MDRTYEQMTLTDAERDDARRQAREKVVADRAHEPDRAAFAGYAVSKYPLAFTAAVGIVLVIVAVAAGTISGIRLYFAGRDYAAETIAQPALTWIIGGSTVLAAEFLVILATVAAQVYMRGWRRGLSVIPVTVGMIVAFVGNWEVSQPSTTWGVVETVFPPIAVLSVAFFFEVALMPELERRTADEKAYQDALRVYNELRARPEQHHDYGHYLRRELWQQWVTAFRDQVQASDIPIADRRLILRRELEAESWLDDQPMTDNTSQQRAIRQPAPDVPAEILKHKGKYRAAAYLRQFPGEEPATADEAEALGARLAVSGRTVYRGVEIVSNNGHGED